MGRGLRFIPGTTQSLLFRNSGAFQNTIARGMTLATITLGVTFLNKGDSGVDKRNRV